MRRVHYEVEILAYTLSQPLCENQAGRDAFARTGEVEMTTCDAEVTCRRCLTALGDKAAPAGQLTVCEADPMRRAA